MFISPLVNGHYYLAQLARRGQQQGQQRYIWLKLPHAPTHNGVRVEPRKVPHGIRRRAYRLFERDRLHASR